MIFINAFFFSLPYPSLYSSYSFKVEVENRFAHEVRDVPLEETSDGKRIK